MYLKNCMCILKELRCIVKGFLIYILLVYT